MSENKQPKAAGGFVLPKGKNFLLLNLGIFLTALGIVAFKAPNHFAMGGTSGLAILFASLSPKLNVGAFMFIINALLVVLGFAFLGKKLGASTVYASVVLSVFIWLLEWLLPIVQPMTQDTLLELIWAVILPAIGAAIVFNVGASTGGTDILALVLREKTSIEVGKALLIFDCIIVLCCLPVFGVATFLYCALGTVIKSIMVDTLMESFNIKKSMTIISKHPDEIQAFIMNVLNRSATVYRAKGAFSGEEQQVVTTILSRRQAMLLRNFIRTTDPEAFMSVVNSSETIGKGFREI